MKLQQEMLVVVVVVVVVWWSCVHAWGNSRRWIKKKLHRNGVCGYTHCLKAGGKRKERRPVLSRVRFHT
jgi:hypothetical protein